MAEDTKLRFPRADSSFSSGGSGHASAARGGSDDPLAELARLIGQDPGFAHMRREPGRCEVEAPASQHIEAASRRLSRGLDPRPMGGMALDMRRATPVAQPVAAYPDPAKAVHASAHAVEQPHYGYDARSYETQFEEPAAEGPAHAEQYYDEPADANADAGYDYAGEEIGTLPKERRRGGLTIVAAVLVLAGIGTAGAFGYRAFVAGPSGPPPVIKADTSPAKVAPAPVKTDTQGSRVIYDRADKGQPERIVTREEQPIEMKEAKPPAPRMAFPSAGGMLGSASPVQAAAPLTPPSTGNPGEPKKVRTVAIRPDGTVVPESARAQPAARPTPPAVVPNPPTAPAQAALPPARAPEPAQTASLPPSAAVGTHVVQIASQRSEAEAQASFRVLQAKYPNVLGGMQPVIQRVDLGGTRGTHFRTQVGPFASVSEANELCSNLKAAGGQCFVRRN